MPAGSAFCAGALPLGLRRGHLRGTLGVSTWGGGRDDTAVLRVQKPRWSGPHALFLQPETGR